MISGAVIYDTLTTNEVLLNYGPLGIMIIILSFIIYKLLKILEEIKYLRK